MLTVCIYDKNLQDTSINAARATMAANRDLDFEKLPPTAAALLQHANRALYQAHIWVNSLVPIQNLPSPAGFGWIKSKGVWNILWTLETMTCKDLEVLVSCKCQTEGECAVGTEGNCKCRRHGKICTPMCSCKCDLRLTQV